MIYRHGLKRLVDILVSLALLVVLSPVIALSWLAVRLSSAGPGFFQQTRVGLGAQPFRIHKLRTMVVNPDRALTQTTTLDPEVIPLCRPLRRLKIDELPQIFNVLAGDMSLVGPRPCMEVTLDGMPAWAKRRFDVRPGLTGLAQISGNVALSWEERWRYDVAYVERCSLWLDLVIILKTIPVIFLGEERFRRIA